MSLTGKFDKHTRRKAGKMGTSGEADGGSVENYVTNSHVRNLSFVMQNGDREFFSYADLSRCQYLPQENKIILTYRNPATVTLKGTNMEKLYVDLMAHIPRQIVCKDDRYKDLKKGSEIYVTLIVII